MKHLLALSGITLALLAGVPLALAQSSPPPPLPPLTPEQSATVSQRMDLYRRQTEGRVSRGEITADEADRLIRWREWQIARQVAGRSNPVATDDNGVPPDYREAPSSSGAPPDYRGASPSDYGNAPPPDYGNAPPSDYGAPPPDYVVVQPPVYYGPYYRYPSPYYWGPYPYRYYWGPTVCAGGFGHHFGGRICF